MSIVPGSFPSVQFAGTPFARPLDNDKPSIPPATVPLNFVWNNYFSKYGYANFSIPINLTGNSPLVGLLDKVRTVKIDNTDSPVFVSVFFLDTGDIVTCAPYSVQTQPVFTNGQSALVIAEGLDSDIGTAQTTVYLSNIWVYPSAQIEKQLTFPQFVGSTSIQRANAVSPGYGPPALGDQMDNGIFATWPAALATSYVTAFGGARSSGFIILNALQITADAQNNSSVQAAIELQLASDHTILPIDVVFDAVFRMTPNQNLGGWLPCNMNGMNVRLDATKKYEYVVSVGALSGGSITGGLTFNSCFTVSDK